ncbi:MAG: nucleoside/nucleotide kinase family protein [Cucumibacter sp.]
MPDRISGNFADAVGDIRDLAVKMASARRGRVMIGIAGGPGAGKSGLAEAVCDAAWPGLPAQVIPMDGFHMRQKKLQRLGLAGDKGAPHTFEAERFIEFVARLRTARRAMPGPAYSREIEDVVPDAYVVSRKERLLIVEGNYLLLDKEPWRVLRDLFDLTIFVSLSRKRAKARLAKRHAEGGLFSDEHIARHVEEVDMVNFDLVAKTASRADLILEITDMN